MKLYKKKEEYLAHIEDTYFLENQISRYEESIEFAKERGNDSSNLQKELDKKALQHFRERLKITNAALNGYAKGDWETFYEYQLFIIRMWNKEFDTGSFDYYMGRGNELATQASIEEKKWLMERNIQPVFSGEFIPTTMYLRERAENWVERNTRIDNSGLFSLYLYFERYIYFVPLAIFLFLLGGGLASERGKKNTLNFLKTQPLAEKKIFLGKFF